MDEANERDYLKAILELLIELGERQTGKRIVVRVGSMENSNEFAAASAQPDGDNVKIV